MFWFVAKDSMAAQKSGPDSNDFKPTLKFAMVSPQATEAV
jgi:hypothetical protein